MPFSKDILMGSSGQSGAASNFYDHQIEQSVRGEMDAGTRLRYTPSGAGNRQTWAVSMWIKRSKLGDEQFLYEAGASGGSSTRLRLVINDDDKIMITNSLSNLAFPLCIISLISTAFFFFFLSLISTITSSPLVQPQVFQFGYLKHVF